MRRLFRTPSDGSIERGFWIVILAVCCFATHLLAFYGGSWWMLEEARAEAAKIITLRKPPPVANPVLLLNCDRGWRDEWARTCRARARTAEVRP